MALPKFTAKQIMMGVGVYFAAAVSGYLYLRSAKAPAPPRCGCGGRHHGKDEEGEGEREDGHETFDRIADQYDELINVDETFMGLKLMRRWLMHYAEGDVLEVSAGTGRNLDYYPLDQLRSLTLTDTSRPMLVNAFDKYAGLVARQAAAPGRVRFELADAQHLTAAAAGGSGGSGSDGSSSSSSGNTAAEADAPATPRQQAEAAPAAAAAAAEGTAGPQRPPLREERTFAPRSFDVVVDTFGLCSQQDPVSALREMARVCKPGGRILLLQHGKGTWGFINNVLDNGAAQHFNKWGCWWNRDIGQIVRQAGLEVERESRWHFGTTYLIVARPPADGSLL